MLKGTKALALLVVAITFTFTVLPAIAQWGGIDSSSPRRMMTSPEEGNGNGVPSQKNPEAVILGKLGVVENAPKVLADGSTNPQIFMNENPTVVQSAVDNNYELAAAELEQKGETKSAMRGTAVTPEERAKAEANAEKFAEYAKEAKTSEERQDWLEQRDKELSRLPNADDMAATIGPATTSDEDGGRGVWFWILVIGIPVVVVAGVITAVIIIRSDDNDGGDNDDDGGDDDDDGGDDDDDGGAAEKPRRQRGSRGSGKSAKKDEVISKS